MRNSQEHTNVNSAFVIPWFPLDEVARFLWFLLTTHLTMMAVTILTFRITQLFQPLGDSGAATMENGFQVTVFDLEGLES